jgi:hypothetical protein
MSDDVSSDPQHHHQMMGNWLNVGGNSRPRAFVMGVTPAAMKGKPLQGLAATAALRRRPGNLTGPRA